MVSQAWAPGHATFIFAAPNGSSNIKDPLLKGSLGAGVNFTAGVKTLIETSDSNQVTWNDKRIDGRVSLTVYDEFQSFTGISEQVKISHASELKIGYGLSTSGAGALGTALALNHHFGTKLSQEKVFQIAHIADAVNHTGLGSVMGQITSGIEIRTKIGGPGVGKATTIPNQDMLVILMMGGLHTDEVLQSTQQMAQVNRSGLDALSILKEELSHLSLERLFQIGYEFTESCGLMTPRVEKISEKLHGIGENIHTMAMIGETLVVKPNNTDNILSLARKYNIQAVVTRITNAYPSVLQ